MSSLSRHEKADKVKWVFTGLAVVLLAGACATSIAMGIKHNGWFEQLLCDHEYEEGICTKCGKEEPEKAEDAEVQVLAGFDFVVE